MSQSKTRSVLLGLALQIALAVGAEPASAQSLPGRYFELMEAGIAKVEARFEAEPDADLKSLENNRGWRHFPYAILAPAVLYAKEHPQNKHYHLTYARPRVRMGGPGRTQPFGRPRNMG